MYLINFEKILFNLSKSFNLILKLQVAGINPLFGSNVQHDGKILGNTIRRRGK